MNAYSETPHSLRNLLRFRDFLLSPWLPVLATVLVLAVSMELAAHGLHLRRMGNSGPLFPALIPEVIGQVLTDSCRQPGHSAGSGKEKAGRTSAVRLPAGSRCPSQKWMLYGTRCGRFSLPDPGPQPAAVTCCTL